MDKPRNRWASNRRTLFVAAVACCFAGIRLLGAPQTERDHPAATADSGDADAPAGKGSAEHSWSFEFPDDDDVVEAVIRQYGDSRDLDEQYQLAQALAAKARDEADPEAAGEAYDAIFRRWRDSADADLRFEAATAVMRKAELLKTGGEKLAALDELVEAFKYDGAEHVWQLVSTAVAARYQLAGDRRWSASLYRDVAQNSPNPRIAALALFLIGMDSLEPASSRLKTIDQLLTLCDGNDALADIRDRALFVRAQLTEDRGEKLRAYSRWAENGDAEDRVHRSRTVRLAAARLSNSPEEKLAIYDELLEEGGPYDTLRAVDAAVPILFLKARLLGDNSVVDAFFDQFGEGMPAEVNLMLMQLKAAATPGDEDKARILDAIFDAYAKDPFPDVGREARKTYLAKLALPGTPAQKLETVDAALRAIEECGDPDMEFFFLLQEKARLLTERRDRIAVYERMAALAETLANPGLAAAPLIEKAELLTERSERAALYRAALERSAENPHNKARALLGLAATTEDGAEEIALYDIIINNPENAADVIFPLDGQLLLEALRRKSAATGQDCLGAFLDARIAGGIGLAVAEACGEKARLAEQDDDKLRFYEMVWRGFVDNPHATLQAMVTRAGEKMLDLQIEPERRLTFCDEIIRRYGDLSLEQSPKTELLARALFEKAALSADREEKRKLYDRVLSLFEDAIGLQPDIVWRERAAEAKAALAGAE